VICSPAAAKSRWVNQEILESCRLQSADRVFCCIVEGDPPGVFPEALAALDELTRRLEDLEAAGRAGSPG
jgi:hypothetical protein